MLDNILEETPSSKAIEITVEDITVKGGGSLRNIRRTIYKIT